MDGSRPKSRSKSRSGDYWGSCDHALGKYGRYGEICSRDGRVSWIDGEKLGFDVALGT